MNKKKLKQKNKELEYIIRQFGDHISPDCPKMIGDDYTCKGEYAHLLTHSCGFDPEIDCNQEEKQELFHCWEDYYRWKYYCKKKNE